MAEKSKNRYSYNGFWFLLALRNHLATPLAVLLALVFLCANATYASVELDTDHRSSATDSYALHSDHELASSPVESREFSAGREISEAPVAPRLQARLSHHKLQCFSILSFASRFAPVDSYPQHLVSPCISPFSPRPPPAFSAQA